MLCTLTTGLLGLPGWLGVVKPGVVEMPGLEPCANATEPTVDRYNAMPDATNLFMNSPSNVSTPNFTTSSRQRFTVLPLPDTAWVGQKPLKATSASASTPFPHLLVRLPA